MKAIVQRVTHASVSIDGHTRSSIGNGLLILLGAHRDDGPPDVDWITRKIAGLRVFADEQGLMNRSIADIDGELLVVSQFTLIASVRKGNRPSFNDAAPAAKGEADYLATVATLSKLIDKPVQTGVFGANMQVTLLNDGPVTIILDSRHKE